MLLNLGLQMAHDTSKKQGMQLKTLWLSIKTHKALKDLAGAIIIALWGCSSPIAWERLTERCLEKRFGRVRTSFPSCVMTASDYFRASANAMRREVHKFQQNPLEPMVPNDPPLTMDDFCGAAQRAMQAALKLSAMCSDQTTSDLQATFNFLNSSKDLEVELLQGEDLEGSTLHCFVWLKLLFFVSLQGLGWIKKTSFQGIQRFNAIILLEDDHVSYGFHGVGCTFMTQILK